MAMTAADLATPPNRAMLDTNVLLAATDEGRAEHNQALPGSGLIRPVRIQRAVRVRPGGITNT
jgi:hypothetical protein